jgi:hypothetical protein
MFMYDIKSRSNVISRAVHVYSNKSSLTGYSESDVELCFLQLRKILELMMFASLVAHTALGRELQKNIIDREWNASKILNYLARVNPDFFPSAIRRDVEDKSPAPQMIPVDGALTREEFGRLYDRVCSKYLHASRDLATLNDHDSLFHEVASWASKVNRLLSSHWIVVGTEKAFAVLMATNPDGYVQVMPMAVTKT